MTDYENIDWGATVQQQLQDFEQRSTVSNTSVDLRKYFALTLPDNEKRGERVFRIMPLTADNPTVWFAEVKFHSIKIGNRWVKLYDPDQDGEESPITELYKQLNRGETKEDKDLAKVYRPKPYYVMRGIERGKEADGPKFWRFSIVDDGIMERIKPIIQRLNAKNPGDGAIWRPDAKGRDLVITVTRDKRNYVIATAIITDDASPLSKDIAEADKWLNDTTTWRDVYRKKPLEYLKVIAAGKEPVWDVEAKKFVAKGDEENEAATHKSIQEQYATTSDKNYGQIPTPLGAEINTTSAVANAAEAPEVDVDEDDLPF